MTTTTVYLDDDEEVTVSGEVEWGDEATRSYYSDDPPSYDRVSFLTVEFDGEDVTDALTARERARCEEALFEAAREDAEPLDPEDRDDWRYGSMLGRGW